MKPTTTAREDYSYGNFSFDLFSTDEKQNAISCFRKLHKKLQQTCLLLAAEFLSQPRASHCSPRIELGVFTFSMPTPS